MGNNLTMTVEGAAGANCVDIIRDMCRLSTRMGIDVQSDLNGVTTTATPYCDIERLCAEWQEEMNSKNKYKFVSGRPMELRAVGKDGSQ